MIIIDSALPFSHRYTRRGTHRTASLFSVKNVTSSGLFGCLWMLHAIYAKQDSFYFSEGVVACRYIINLWISQHFSLRRKIRVVKSRHLTQPLWPDDVGEKPLHRERKKKNLLWHMFAINFPRRGGRLKCTEIYLFGSSDSINMDINRRENLVWNLLSIERGGKHRKCWQRLRGREEATGR